ncbi:MAG: hypothetical protein WDZ42_01215 [Candidatus Saccharimonadales bacterium]
MKHVLILEDLLEVQAVLIKELASLENELEEMLLVTTYSSPEDVVNIINYQSADTYDVIILDRNAKSGGSFHELDIEKFGAEKIISTSSMPHLNEKIKERGVYTSVDKNLGDLSHFAKQVVNEVRKILVKLS